MVAAALPPPPRLALLLLCCYFAEDVPQQSVEGMVVLDIIQW